VTRRSSPHLTDRPAPATALLAVPPPAISPGAFHPPTVGAQYGTEHEAAAVLGLSAATLRTWRARRRGPACWKRFGHSVRYNPDELRAWTAAQPGAHADAA